ncbi:MAG TPA: carboxypeptidase regulatory-like domain-containing protein [Candidatus Ozemobacteraceae bacterium]|nr:carboxypeptidase regulatory-like domain-containing protein [Candidatus Ozemobacteraceae bacterium]
MSHEDTRSHGRKLSRISWRRQIAAALRQRAADGRDEPVDGPDGHRAGRGGAPASVSSRRRLPGPATFVACLIVLLAFGLIGCENEQKIQRGVVSGAITDTAGNRLADATVTAHRSLFTAVSDESGRYAFTSLDAGSQRLTVTKEGFKPASVTMTLEAGLVYDNVNFRLEPLHGKITCNIFKREADAVTFDVFPAEPMKCTFVYQGTHLPQIRTVPTGLGTDHRFVIRPPVPGIVYSYFVEGITADDRRYITETATFTTLPAGDLAGAPPVPVDASVVQTADGPKITWSYDGVDPLKGFRIWRGENAGPLTLWQTEEMMYANDRFLVDSEPNPGVRTRYAIEAVDLDGNVSSRTAELVILPAGMLKQSVIWQQAWSPIDLGGDIEVPALTTLTIEPGTVIRVNPTDLSKRGIDPTRCELVVDGRLIVAASGTAAVRFLSAASLPGREDWLGIRLRTLPDQPSGSEIANLELVNARDGLHVTDGPLQLAGFGARMCGTGLHLEGASGTVVTHLTFKDCTTGLLAEGTSNVQAKTIVARGGDVGVHLRGNRGAFLGGIDVRAVMDTALIVDDTAAPTIRGAVLDAARLGLIVRGAVADVLYLTIDAPNGIFIDGADQPLLRNNILVNRRAPATGVGIEERTAGRSYIYNNIFGFYAATSGCDQSGAPVLNIDPLFVGAASGEYDYHLSPASLLLTSSETGGQMGAYGWIDPDTLAAE